LLDKFHSSRVLQKTVLQYLLDYFNLEDDHYDRMNDLTKVKDELHPDENDNQFLPKDAILKYSNESTLIR